MEWTVFNGAARDVPHFEAVDGDVSLTPGLRFNPFAIGHDDVVLVAGHLRALPRDRRRASRQGSRPTRADPNRTRRGVPQ